MLRIELELSLPGTDHVLPLAEVVADLEPKLGRAGAVVHRLTVEEVDA